MRFFRLTGRLGLLLSLTVIVLLLANCKKWFIRECRKDAPLVGGIILREIGDGCYTTNVDVPKTMVYTRQTQWDSQWAKTSSCSSPDVDFTKESVLLFYNTFGSGIKCIQKVERDPAHMAYVYSIEEFDCSQKMMRTKELGVSRNVIVVPKLPDGWTVRFVNFKH